MTKELIDLAWSCLPKEFKEEVKKIYQDLTVNYDKYTKEEAWDTANAIYSKICILREVFGWNNLTSDAEGEEMLTVEKGKVQFMFDGLECTRVNDEYDRGYKAGKEFILHGLFGSKCLPDEHKECSNPSVVNCKHKHGDGTCSLDNKCCHKSQKPAGPKYKRGDNVMYDGTVQTIVGENIRCGREYYLSGVEYPVAESDLEPYTEPEERNHIAQDLEMVDNIIKDGFSKEHRLNIAAMALQGLLSNTALYEHKVKEWLRCESNDNPIKFIPMLALKYADSLIAEAKKGGSK